jgi:TonB family protein
MIALFLKCTLILLAAMLGCYLLRKQSAAGRRLVWLAGLSATLLLPLGGWLPKTHVRLPTIGASAKPLGTGSIQTRTAVDWISVAWAAGSALCFMRLLVGICRTARMIRGGALDDTEAGVATVTVRQLDGPAAWGIGRKLVLLPACASDWPVERRQLVLMHERAHLTRHDNWALLIAEAACALYWPNPLVWFAARYLRLELEHTADDEVLRSGANPAEYARHLIAIARASRCPTLATGAIQQSDLRVRIKAILDQRRVRRMTMRKTLFVSVALLFALTIPLASMQSQGKIYSVKDAGVTAPRLVNKTEPDYTQEAKDAKIQGRVMLSAIIDVDGKAHEVKVEEGLDAGLDANAISAIGAWVFEPAKRNSEPVPVAVKIEVNFRLQ